MERSQKPVTRRNALSSVGLSIATFAAVGFTSRPENEAMGLYYLEIVATDPEATCDLYSQMYSVVFGGPDPNLGGARTARLASGSLMGVRARLNATERPVTRSYFIVDDIESAVAAAESAGAEITVPPMPVPGHGTCAIIYHAGVESGLWQV
jgi:uncharacterized protein